MALKASLIEFLLSQVRDSVQDLAGGTVTFYEAGTTNKKDVYTAPDKLTTVANPLTLDSNSTYQVYGDGNYKIVIKDPSGVTIYTRDNYYAGLDVTSIDWTTITTSNTPSKNYLVNGGFNAWSFATSQTSSGEGSDNQWYNLHSGSSKTASRQTFTLGQTDVPYEPVYFSRTVATTSAGASNYVLKQARIAGVQTLAGQQVTLSFYAKADAAKSIAVEFVQSFGTGDSPSADVTGIGATQKLLSTSWAQYTVTATLSSVSGKTLGSGGDDYLAVNFWFDAGSSFNARTGSLGQQSGTFDIALVKLETGSTATAFVRDFTQDTLLHTTTAFMPTVPTRGADGSVSAPSYSFSADTNTGIYRIGADNVGVACNGAKVLGVGTTGVSVVGAAAASGAVSGASLSTAGNCTSDQLLIGAGAYAGTVSYSAAKGIFVGATSNHKTSVISNNTTVAEFTTTGLAVTGDISVSTKTPASATAAGIAGTITWDANYIYVCVTTNTWKRVAIATW